MLFLFWLKNFQFVWQHCSSLRTILQRLLWASEASDLLRFVVVVKCRSRRKLYDGNVLMEAWRTNWSRINAGGDRQWNAAQTRAAGRYALRAILLLLLLWVSLCICEFSLQSIQCSCLATPFLDITTTVPYRGWWMNKTVDFFHTFTFFPYKRHGLEWVVNSVVKSSSNF